MSVYSKTSLNQTLLFQKVVRFSKISVYTKCRIAPANRTKFGLWGGFSDVSARKLQPASKSEHCSDSTLLNRNLFGLREGKQVNPNIVRIALPPNLNLFSLYEGTQVNPNIVWIAPCLAEIRSV